MSTKTSVPIAGRVALEVTDPNGQVIDRRPLRSNRVLPWLPYLLWSMLSPVNSYNITRFTDGTWYYPSWADLAAGMQIGSTGVYYTGSVNGGSQTNVLGTLGTLPRAGLAVGNYNGIIPTGDTSHIQGSQWQGYATHTSGSNGNSASYAWGRGSTRRQGAAINSTTITGVAPPRASTRISHTYAAQAGTVNAVMFYPVSRAQTAIQNESPGTSFADWPTFWIPSASSNPPATGTLTDVAVGSSPFGDNNVVATTLFISPSPVVVPQGGNLTISYELALNL